MSLNPRRETFADQVAAGVIPTDAALRAGYAPSRAAATATELMKSPEVRERIELTRTRLLIEAGYDPEDAGARALFARLSGRLSTEATADSSSGPRQKPATPARTFKLPAWSVFGAIVAAVVVLIAVLQLGQSSDPPAGDGGATLLPTASSGATPTPLPRSPSARLVTLSTDTRTEYYSVRGTNASAIFDSIEAAGLTDSDGAPASGLIQFELSWVIRKSSIGSFSCQVTGLDVELQLLVTLPRHVSEAALPASLTPRWRQFVESTRQHEQRHADIETDQAEALVRSVEAISSWSNCDRFDRDLEQRYEAYRRETDELQDAFHAEEEEELRVAEAPIQAAIERNDATLARIDATLAGLDARITAIKAQYPDLVLPEPEYTEYEGLITRYNGLVNSYDEIVSETNALNLELLWLD